MRYRLASFLFLFFGVAALPAATGRVSGPIGRFRLASVDGVRVPMVWRHVDDSEAGSMQLHWVSGRAEFRRDGRFEVTLTALRSGRGLRGNPESLILKGTWRMTAGFRVELQFADGHVSPWGKIGELTTLTLKTPYPDLDGELRVATMLLVRD